MVSHTPLLALSYCLLARSRNSKISPTDSQYLHLTEGCESEGCDDHPKTEVWALIGISA